MCFCSRVYISYKIYIALSRVNGCRWNTMNFFAPAEILFCYVSTLSDVFLLISLFQNCLLVNCDWIDAMERREKRWWLWQCVTNKVHNPEKIVIDIKLIFPKRKITRISPFNYSNYANRSFGKSNTLCVSSLHATFTLLAILCSRTESGFCTRLPILKQALLIYNW